MNLARKLPIGIQSFDKLRRDRCLYIDKTAFVWQLVQVSSPYFLSRPRRFGKSLFLSTLAAY
ncbi:MAG: AAA family ATPase, partial [Treponema sp.]|uniref:AAA family ATPase n=1 Tax=Treponema sp. TaxID=166 RepID=UPI003FA26EAF